MIPHDPLHDIFSGKTKILTVSLTFHSFLSCQITPAPNVLYFTSVSGEFASLVVVKTNETVRILVLPDKM